ncbi:hypothetical protein ACH41E_30180 [Streptomyces sp. NPDC020412]|uniref:hypothetical protein n=1 Tax=Streptomyces sp. NPDC020412 TaxID=3365073 RepID=UPI0037A38E67
MRPATHAITDRLAAAVREQALSACSEVRGADWRTAMVATVNADGTVTTADGVTARRLASYPWPRTGDQVVISQSSAGNWIDLAETAAAGAGTWTAITLAAGWTATVGYYTPAYRINDDGTGSLSGMSSMTGTLAAGATVATLPTEARPASRVRVTAQVAAGYFGVLTLDPGGAITTSDFSATLPGTGTKYAQFDTFTRYRLL